MNGLEWTGVLTASALLITALAAAVPRVVASVGSIASGWSSRAKAQEVTADTVRGIVDSMRAALEARIAKLEGEHSVCTKALSEMRDANTTLRDRVAELEALVKTQGEKIAKYEGLLAAAAEERDALQSAIEAGGGAQLHALPTPTKDHPVDVVHRRGGRARKDG
jgi:septal ring factor EnvC (AmiA/AmiB activator)